MKISPAMKSRASEDRVVDSQALQGDVGQSVNLTVIFRVAITGWYWLIIGGLLFAIAFGIYSSRSPRVYRAEVMVTVVQDIANGTGGTSGVASSLGAVASSVGLNLGGGSDRRAEYMAVLSSRRLIADLIEKHDLLPVLYASRWDAATRTWKSTWSQRGSPTINAAIEYFLKKVVFVVEDRKTGLVKVTVEWFDPARAAEWANTLVTLVNLDVRQNTIADAKNTLEFLNKELERTSAIQVREGIFRLIEGSLSRIALANVQQQYALKILDPARTPDPGQYVRPRPLLAAIAGGMFGGTLALLVLLWRSRREWLI